jgi:hypothetical protein
MTPTLRLGVIPVLVAGASHAACADARGWLDTEDKPRYDNGRQIDTQRLRLLAYGTPVRRRLSSRRRCRAAAS